MGKITKMTRAISGFSVVSFFEQNSTCLGGVLVEKRDVSVR
jgi:hypothetical protein